MRDKVKYEMNWWIMGSNSYLSSFIYPLSSDLSSVFKQSGTGGGRRPCAARPPLSLSHAAGECSRQQESAKACGNASVPQVAYECLRQWK